MNPKTKEAPAIGHLMLAFYTSIKNSSAVTELKTMQASRKLMSKLDLIVSSISPWSEDNTVDFDRHVINLRALYSSAELCLSELL